ncbi:hypothetical protein HYFRA_00011050 [Hymenoscyphus fraxineus]|uniref:DUF7730 domain-containing protein n=1 Tax=Hymenoscyphus fraxineus TaxID=746836 RepID=A0A9N9PX08_9HELO|nr:hypothetical protein HYFRA_00011050 [Hymenoscyphus fraxineus]
MPPTQSDTVHSDEVQQRPGFNIDAPMTPRQQAIYESNKASSPLLRLPPEVRLAIWELLIGENTIHVVRHHLPFSWSTICQSPVTASHAYQLSRCPAYEESMDRGSKADMRCWINRHRTCIERPPNTRYLDLGILTLCRLTYMETMDTIWRTNTWTFSCNSLFKDWLLTRTTAQMRYISRIHLDRCVTRHLFSLLAKRKEEPLKLLQIYISPDNLGQIAEITKCPPAGKIEVIFFDWKVAHADAENESTSQMKLWERSVAVAEELHVSLMEKMRKC